MEASLSLELGLTDRVRCRQKGTALRSRASSADITPHRIEIPSGQPLVDGAPSRWMRHFYQASTPCSQVRDGRKSFD